MFLVQVLAAEWDFSRETAHFILEFSPAFDVSSSWLVSFQKQCPLVDEEPYISAERSLGNHQSTEAFRQVASQITTLPTGNSLKHVEYFASVSSGCHLSSSSNSLVHLLSPVLVQCGCKQLVADMQLAGFPHLSRSSPGLFLEQWPACESSVVFPSHFTFLSAVDGLAIFSSWFSYTCRHGGWRTSLWVPARWDSSPGQQVQGGWHPTGVMYLTPTFLKYFPVAMEQGVLTDIKWNNISGPFVRSLVLLMTYMSTMTYY